MSSLETQVCDHVRTKCHWPVGWNRTPLFNSNPATGSQPCSPSLALLFTNYLLLLLLLAGSPSHFWKTQYIIIFKYSSLKKSSSPPLFYHPLPPLFPWQALGKTSQHSMCSFPLLLSSACGTWLLLSPSNKTSPVTWLIFYVLTKFNSYFSDIFEKSWWHLRLFFLIIFIEITLFWFSSHLSCYIFFLAPNLKCWYSLIVHP